MIHQGLAFGLTPLIRELCLLPSGGVRDLAATCPMPQTDDGTMDRGRLRACPPIVLCWGGGDGNTGGRACPAV